MSVTARIGIWLALTLPLMTSSHLVLAQDKAGSGPIQQTSLSKGAVAASHPVDAPLALLRKCEQRYAKIRDYTATIVRQELVGKTLLSEQTIEAKFRSEPFSVYYKWLDPDAGKELIFCNGQNDDKVVSHTTGFAKALMGPSKVDPDSTTAMKGTRQSVREAGVGKLIERLITRLEFERQFDKTKIETKHMKINGKPCYMIVAVHPEADDGKFMYHTMKIYIDKAEMLPVRVEVYGYPEKPGTEPGGLLEMYTYLDLVINPGLSDFDFSTRNPEYSFSRF